MLSPEPGRFSEELKKGPATAKQGEPVDCCQSVTVEDSASPTAVKALVETVYTSAS